MKGLFLTSCSRSFQDTQIIETGLSDFCKMNLTVLKSTLQSKIMRPFSTEFIKNLITSNLRKH